jgi:energy-coupling factor transporter ATP-binding protein EcfA2
MNPEKITYFAETDSRNRRAKFGIKAKDRTKHVYVIGKTGMGKSTLLENMAIQDIQNGEGLAFIDPHGGTAEKLLEYVPKERIKDVLYFAPFDMEYPVSFNVMEDIGIDKRHLVVNGLMSTFEKIWVDAWSARMAYILNNTLLALLEFPGSTLLGVNRMLSDKDYRKKVVENVTDPSVKSFWIDEFGKYTERFAAEATPAIQNKVGQFTSNPLVRNLIGQPKSTFNIRKMMDEKKILIINLSKGKVGEGNANLIGSMLITKIYLAAMSRADSSETALKNLPNFYLYVDEFQSFANKSFADILSEARKYKLNLTIAHQYIEQMEEEVRDAVFGNVGTMITFRVGAFDAEVLEKEFAPTFTAEDLVNLGFVQIYLKLMIDGISSSPFSATTMPPIAKPDISYRHDVVENSRANFARPRAEVENEIKNWHDQSFSSVTNSLSAPDRPPVRSVPRTETRNFDNRDRPPVNNMQPVRSDPPNFQRRENDEKKGKTEIFEAIMKEEKKKIQERSFDKPKLPISLGTLKPNDKNSKNPTPEHVSQLREALAKLTSNVKPTVVNPQPAPTSQIPKQAPQPTNPVSNKPNTPEPTIQKNVQNNTPSPSVAKKSQPAEIPEDELQKLLHVDQ